MARRRPLDRGEQLSLFGEGTPSITPPKPRGQQFDDPGLDSQEQADLGLDTRDIGARQTTGVAQRAIASDVEQRFDWIPFDSSRVQMGAYNEEVKTIRVRFADGTPWEYREVPPKVWERFQQSESPGAFIHQVLDNFPYGRGKF